MSCFSFTKSESKRVEQVLPGVGVGTSGREEEEGKWCGRMNIVQILYTDYANGKMIPVETSRNGGGE
jgi:hypothetical protein